MMKVGIVCPYSVSVVGGVQSHVLELAEQLIRWGHEVSVLAPTDETLASSYVTAAGDTAAIRFNGSVARLALSRQAVCGTKEWLSQGGFDIVHVHEPFVPVLGLASLHYREGPLVATFHASLESSLLRRLSAPLLKRLSRKITRSIAVSSQAQRTLTRFEGLQASIIPNGISYSLYRGVEALPAWEGEQNAPTIGFLGRLDEPRKGFSVLAQAIPTILREYPHARFLIAGPGGGEPWKTALVQYGDRVRFLGPIYGAQKAAFLRAMKLFVAPQCGGESFGIVLVEAMSAGCAVVASDLPAFNEVLGAGSYGRLFPNGDSGALSRAIISAIEGWEATAALALSGMQATAQYDWEIIAEEILQVYRQTAESGGGE